MPRERRNVTASVHARLLRLARARGQELQRLLVHYALERFLYRLGQSDHCERFVLKGAMLFHVWERSLPRATRDLDLLSIGRSSEASILATFEQLWRIQEVEDGLELDRDSVTSEIIRNRAVDAGVRVKCRVRLGTAIIPLQIDIGAGDAMHPAAELVDYPTLLDFPAPCILAYPREAVVAEKVQAIVELGLLNSRLKDYFDVCYLARTRAFEGSVLQEAMRATFDRRDTPIPRGPIEALGSDFIEDPIKQSQWTGFQRRAGLDPQELGDVVATVRGFIEPVVLAIGRGRAFEHVWPPGGPWKLKEET